VLKDISIVEEISMDNREKLDKWAEKLLNTGKRNNLVNFKDARALSAQILYPSCEEVFTNFISEHTYIVYDPQIDDEETDLEETIESAANKEKKKLTADEFRVKYEHCIKSNSILAYAQTPNPITAVKNIAKKAKEMREEIGINAAYLAFGFMKWNEKEGSETFYKAPLLLLSVNIITASALDPVKIELNEDDVVVNPTFDYMLRENYGISLPAFDDEDTLESYLEKVKNKSKKKEWEVLCECKLGLFSFLKISMYHDLKENANKIINNQNVKMLLGEHNSAAYNHFSKEREYYGSEPLIDLHTVVPADASQIEAIEMAKTGHSFVLQGPPGTGKSQTITNIISECLYDGKKVLFVSEKQAALNIVYDKLKKAGLEDFCLELHSHKANKKTVISELNRTLESTISTVDPRVQTEIEQKKEAMNTLEAYVASLHRKIESLDLSPFELFGKFAAKSKYPEINYTIRNISLKGRTYFQKALNLLDRYCRYVPSVGKNYRNNPWYGFNPGPLDFEKTETLKEDLQALSAGMQQLKKASDIISQKYNSEISNYIEAVQWQKLLFLLAESDVIVPALLTQSAFNFAIPYVKELKQQSEKMLPNRNKIIQVLSAEAIDKIDAKTLKQEMETRFSSSFSRLFNSEYKHIIAQLSSYIKNGNKLKYHQAVELINNLAELQSDIAVFNNTEAKIHGALGKSYKGIDTDWNHVCSELNNLKNYITDNTKNFEVLSQIKPYEFENAQKGIYEDAQSLKNITIKINAAIKRVNQYFTPDVYDLETCDFESGIIKLDLCISEFDKLKNWMDFQLLLQDIKENDLSEYIDKAIEQHISTEDIKGAYERAYYQKWSEFAVFLDPVLSAFSRVEQDQAVQKFSEKDALQYEINKNIIKSKLSQQRPDLDLVAGGSSVAILRREGQKKRKQMPIRQLLSTTGELVQRIKPCFLMSPLSVSAYLDSEIISFDTVVFDEASQVFPQDAIGAIYRGKQLIVVGDSKQMPPSNFFNASVETENDDEEMGDIADFESILDICSTVFDTKRLIWHYRSHYEQLIAFSNLHFYNNNLITFPSSKKDQVGIGVDYYPVNGVFDRKNKTNKEEAIAVVDLIYKNIATHPERSLGVVAFSAAQQNMIDRMLSKRREKDPTKEFFFGQDKAEPFFIKNLETVQGDERGTIIFSIAYAKDSLGRFLQNFGPLNRQGGERRLNVAVTRARDNIQVVSSIKYTDIDLKSAHSKGAELLRAYLDYAQNGEVALKRTLTATQNDQFDSDFEMSVCDYLRDQGFTVDTQVGCSGYRIDLGLRRPNSSDYVLAIECDGATYHSLKNARDRDCLRQSVLESMGWRFYRIWSTDWFRSPSIEKEKLLKAAKEAINSSTGIDALFEKQSQCEQKQEEKIKVQYVTEVSHSRKEFPKYRQRDASRIMARHSCDFIAGIKEILEYEAPLSEEYLLKRILEMFGREKLTNVVFMQFDERMKNCQNQGIIRRDGFLYLQDNHSAVFRIPGDRPEDKREIKYIAIEELADGFYTLIKENIAINKDGLYKKLRDYLGFSRTGNAIEERFDKAIQMLKDCRRIEERDGMFTAIK